MAEKEIMCCETEEIHQELLKKVNETMPEETELLRSILKKVMDNVERLAGKETLE